MPSARPRRVSREVVYKGRVFRIERDVVRLPDGATMAMEAVRHRGSVVMIAQPTADTIILIRQYRYVIGRWVWELPAGTLEPGELPSRAARRECEEETGFRPRRVRQVGMYYPSPGFCDERMFFYHCTDLVRPAHPRAGDPDEQIEPRTYTIREVQSLIERRDVIDMKTVVGLALVTCRTAPE